MAAPRQIASVKIASKKAEDPGLYQALQDIVNKMNGYILDRPAGRVTLIGGMALALEEKTLADSIILLAVEIPSGTLGTLWIGKRVPGVSFEIRSTSATDTSTVVYQLVNL